MSARSGGLFVGRLALESGVGILLEALDLYPGARVEVVGAGREAARLREHPRVRLPGHLASEELRDRMQRAAYLILPSLSDDAETQPLIMAYAAGLPVIASRLASLADLVEPGRNGLLFEPGSARDLARRLAWAEAFPERMRQMGECAQADYQARFVAHWDRRRLYGERRLKNRGQSPIP
jgi:glycosyltransferase involved in cell wall biosynthesis